ncbi:MAG: maleylpyruvate isomerase N-terminal domain-containing protein [Chloroflexi bacterium]|nr:maleylpyruvate isomerase N-terminal domain-containing protein [Chloroflexota bacterium]
MFENALEFLELEREAWRPYEALDSLTDEELDVRPDGAHGWSGRDLMAHVLSWQGLALEVARELAVGETSRAKERADADWDARGGEVVNAEIQATWAALPVDELRRRFREQPGELRGTLTTVPESRWLKHPTNLTFLADETLDHYEEHTADLDAVVSAAAAARGGG